MNSDIYHFQQPRGTVYANLYLSGQAWISRNAIYVRQYKNDIWGHIKLIICFSGIFSEILLSEGGMVL